MTRPLIGPGEHGDAAEWRELTGEDNVHVSLDDPPAWLDTSATCSLCGELVGQHDTVTVHNNSGDIVSCVDSHGEQHVIDPRADWDGPW